MLKIINITFLRGLVKIHTGGIARELFNSKNRFNYGADSKVWMVEGKKQKF